MWCWPGRVGGLRTFSPCQTHYRGVVHAKYAAKRNDLCVISPYVGRVVADSVRCAPRLCDLRQGAAHRPDRRDPPVKLPRLRMRTGWRDLLADLPVPSGALGECGVCSNSMVLWRSAVPVLDRDSGSAVGAADDDDQS